MGKPTVRKKKSSNGKLTETSSKNGSKSVLDQDMAIFIDMSIQLKEEGNKLFQKRDYEGAIHKYDKAIRLLPKSHKDIAYLHSNIAACYMQMKPEEYYRAINACNLALESSPKYTKALIKRARCFEAINRADLAFKDVDLVLSLEPNNVSALEISERVKKFMEINGIKLEEKEKEIVSVSAPQKIVVPKEVISKKKKKDKSEKNKNKLFVKEDESFVKEEKKVVQKKEEIQEKPMIAIKFVYGDDIRNAQIPTNCTVLQLREIVCTKFPSLKAFLVKYKDTEGDLVTITTSDELNLAKNLSETQNSIKLFITEANPDQELVSEEGYNGNSINGSERNEIKWENSENGSVVRETEDWIVQFARLFKNHVGLDSDSYLDLHDLGIKLYSEAMEETLTSDEAQEIFSLAEKKYREMACLAFFNWGNVHMSKARKMLYLPDGPNTSKELILKLISNAFEYSKTEYTKAEEKYSQALRVNPEFYEAHLALSQQYFEQAKLHWYYTLVSKSEPSETVLLLFNQAEEHMEQGTQIWSQTEEKRLKSLHKSNSEKLLLNKFNLGGLYREVSKEEAAELAGNMKSQINILWGTMVYERSVVEFKLGFGTWEECLMESIEKFKDAGASPTDIAVMIKNHCANETAQEGFGFKIDEIIQAWNEMYDAKRWTSGVPSFRLEPLFRRRAPKLHNVLEHIQHV
ncbi:hypothetical protein LUZ60_007078 [Juncus effusus]|nr:hypothetical protein LUZ60_007078 [Juncus effusus]